MFGFRLTSARATAAALLFGLCAACAQSNGSLREACSEDSLAVKPAACGGDLQEQVDDATRAVTDIQRLKLEGGGAGP